MIVKILVPLAYLLVSDAPMSRPQPGDGVYVITCRHGICTEIRGRWLNTDPPTIEEWESGVTEGKITSSWVVVPTEDSDIDILR